MTAHVIAEGNVDQELIKSVLAASEPPTTFKVTAAGGKSSASSIARSLLVTRQGAVVLVIDADTTDERLINQQRSEYEESLGQFAQPALFRVVLAIPEMERCFFEVPDLVNRLVGVKPSDTQSVKAEYEPKLVLKELIAEGKRLHSISEVIALLSLQDRLDSVRPLDSTPPAPHAKVDAEGKEVLGARR